MRLVSGLPLMAMLSGVVSGCASVSPNSSAPDDEISSAPVVASIAEPSPTEESTALTRKGTELTSDFSRSKLIAADFVATIAQIPATDPATTTLHTDKPTTRFGEVLLGSLQKAGFDLRIGSDSSDPFLVYNAVRDEQPTVDGNPVYTFIIAAGDVKLKRSYEVDQYGVRPTGGMFVRGASVNNVVSDDSMFSISRPKPAVPAPENNLDTPVIKPVPADPLPKPDFNPAPTIAEANFNSDTERYLEKTNKVLTAEEKLRLEQARELEESVAALAPARDLANGNDFGNSDAYEEVPNIYVTKQSRYQDIFKDYEVVDSSVLVFPNDSLLLGRDNKNAIRQYANSFNAETDVMSVIGCSHGATNLENGNGYLANGRAFRVKEEFLSVGLTPKQVLEEGCWADVAYPAMPARGVLLQHKRLVNN